MCYLDDRMKRRQPHLSIAQIERLLEKIPPSVRYVSFTGGEPLMHKDFISIVQRVHRKGFVMSLNTNGTLFHPESLRTINRYVHKFSSSIDGPREIHNAIRGRKYAFDRTMSVAAILSKKKKNTVGVVSVISEGNVSLLPDIVQSLHEFGLKRITFEYERRYTEGTVTESAQVLGIPRSDFMVQFSPHVLPAYTLETLCDSLEKAEKYAGSYHMEIRYLPRLLRRHIRAYYSRNIRCMGKCTCGYLNVLRIDSQGNVVPCFAIRRSMGNLVSDSFDEIWNSSDFRRYRTRLLADNLLPICETCWRLTPLW
jgi:radical SAM protein with 4Fe4S-binding SPASM domain